MTSGCECNFNKGKRCSTWFEESHYQEIRNSCAELDHDSLDLVIKAQIMAHINTLNKGEGRHYYNNNNNNSLSTVHVTEIAQYT